MIWYFSYFLMHFPVLCEKFHGMVVFYGLYRITLISLVAFKMNSFKCISSSLERNNRCPKCNFAVDQIFPNFLRKLNCTSNVNDKHVFTELFYIFSSSK